MSVFFDLDVPLEDVDTSAPSDGTPGATATETPPAASVRSLAFDSAAKRMDVGYDGGATNHIVVGRLQPKDTFSAPLGRVTSVQETFLKATGKPGFHVFSRITLATNGQGNQQINSGNPVLNSYDIVAVRPTTEKAFQAACSTYEIDLISLDLSEKLPFIIKIGPVNAALQRGIFFEISYAKSIRNQTARRNVISNTMALIRFCKGKNVILSSGALTLLDLRGPYDVINMGCLFGLNQAEAKACLSANTRAVLYHGATRRNTYRAVLSIEPTLGSSLGSRPGRDQAGANGPHTGKKRARDDGDDDKDSGANPAPV